ncbi:Double-strand-specific pac1 ribonuclease [Cercospora beticola]|uniref:ribonuclease III n=1 Tax=Cercospora beticola TaxID=122368 RepID=A0A2G5I013_CERBT|nr:Double-strand-specific pac1 ribonuclease [Cercospora beticola]PIA98110.1 Double-strand-specific pac1 ribonuclease [Cercospora beticola]WPA99147.1 hypothetical protein RHO25_003763 [Cercospora beticola]
MNHKRSHYGDGGGSPKRHKSGSGHHRNHDRHDRHNRPREARSHQSGRTEKAQHHDFLPNASISHAKAVQKLPPSSSSPHYMRAPAEVSLSVGTDLPQLPPVKDEYRQASFRHKSHYNVSREVAAGDVTYERLEFLGDAYLELFASRLIYGRYPQLPAGRMSQLRELLVKNETLAEYSRAYRFHELVEVGGEVENMMRDSQGRGNKGFNKILGDVFEAYVAAIVLSDFNARGYDTAEQWCVTLWAPRLLKAIEQDPLAHHRESQGAADLTSTYDVNAKATLQKRLCGANLVRLHYDTDKPTVELKGDKLGQNVHFIALYVESAFFAIEKRLLAKAEGKNKVEAGNWAAVKAMYDPTTMQFVKELEQKVLAERERRNEAKKKATSDVKADGE